jgi:rhodanese-related sulfurtransferase
MPTATTLRSIDIDDALRLVDSGAAFLDLRDVDGYLDVHIPGSINVLYEFGPGFNSRARDCIPLDVPLILLDLGVGDLLNAAPALRGKGFDVLGKVDDGINKWVSTRGNPASTEVVTEKPENATVLHVNDPGAQADDADLTIPIEELWGRTGELGTGRIVVVAGVGVRAAIAVGILERAGHDAVFWKTQRS